MNILRELLIFPKGILGGVGAALGMWIAINGVYAWRSMAAIRAAGLHGNVGTAGGWTYLCRTPGVIALLALAFGLGFYLATRP